MYHRSIVRKCRPADLLLDKFALKIGKPELSQQLSKYITARKAFIDLIEKYEVFAPKAASVEQAAKMVGLNLPKSKSS
jgi:hypothetical protein